WVPTAHHKNPDVMTYIEKFINTDLSKMYIASRSPKLFYLWGHSFEFDRDGNWNLLSDICEKLSGHDDIWYATNIEIYNYTKAYDSLIYSADGTMIYNPTTTTLWFDTDGKLYSVKPDETIKLL
ncbi:MAG: polysaccharide deacetylase, partial [Clostridia bacterium]|nr:polysaccharide deacetylase [Clostridia bacterium]